MGKRGGGDAIYLSVLIHGATCNDVVRMYVHGQAPTKYACMLVLFLHTYICTYIYMHYTCYVQVVMGRIVQVLLTLCS